MDNPIPARERGASFGDPPAGFIAFGPFAKGSAPSDTEDLKAIRDQLYELFPEVQIEQLTANRPTDDDGLWFIWLPNLPGEIQIESSTGTCPFLIETDKHDERFIADSPRAAVEIISKWLRMPGGRTNSPWHIR